MCGRFAFYSAREAMPALFGVDDGAAVAPRYNIAPTQHAAVVRLDAEGHRQAAMLRWGLVPFWAKDMKIGNRLINARVETAAEKPAFRAAWSRRRCLVPADGFYEWRSAAGGKTPWFISASNGEPFAMAGLWERWTSEGGTEEPVETFTILTTEAREPMSRLHDRMPVILGVDRSAAWLAGEAPAGTGSLADPSLRLRAWPVSRRVNSPRNEDPSLVEPAADERLDESTGGSG
ncbi:MAG: SOS response-associated peptidase [Gammaproteobacteria bacterium]|jgi:putative SOS response-associated peptidase YedK